MIRQKTLLWEYSNLKMSVFQLLKFLITLLWKQPKISSNKKRFSANSFNQCLNSICLKMTILTKMLFKKLKKMKKRQCSCSKTILMKYQWRMKIETYKTLSEHLNLRLDVTSQVWDQSGIKLRMDMLSSQKTKLFKWTLVKTNCFRFHVMVAL